MTTKLKPKDIVYQTNPDGEYFGQNVLDEGDFCKITDELNLPGGCVIEKPPTKKGFWPVRDGDNWKLIEDHRKEKWFKGEQQVVITSLGPDAVKGLTKTSVTPPPPELTPEDFEAETRRRILKVASQARQINLIAKFSAGKFNADQMALYAAGMDWIDQLRTRGKQLAFAKDKTFRNDVHWPVLDQAVIDFVGSI